MVRYDFERARRAKRLISATMLILTMIGTIIFFVTMREEARNERLLAAVCGVAVVFCFVSGMLVLCKED